MCCTVKDLRVDAVQHHFVFDNFDIEADTEHPGVLLGQQTAMAKFTRAHATPTRLVQVAPSAPASGAKRARLAQVARAHATPGSGAKRARLA